MPNQERTASSPVPRHPGPWLAVSLCALAAALASGGARAATVTQGATDVPGVFSFNTSGNWSPTGAPSAGNSYFNNGSVATAFATRTPTGTSGSVVTFAGAALSLGASSGTNCSGSACYGQLILTSTGVVYTVPALNMNGGRVNIATESGIGTYIIDGSMTLNAATILAEASAANKIMDVRAMIGGVGNLSILGSGEVILRSSGNSYTGTTGIGPTATVRLGANGAVNNLSSNLGVQGTLLLNGYSASAQGLTGPSGGKVQNAGTANSTLTLGGSTIDRTFNGVISKGTGAGDIAIVKNGAFREIFTGANSYGLGTAINEGQLRVSGATAAVGTGTIEILNDASGTLEVANGANVANAITINGRSGSGTAHIDNVALTSTVSGAIALADGASADPDNYVINSTAGTLNLTGGINSSLTGTRTLELSGGGNGNINTGAVSFNASANNTLNKTGTGTWSLDSAVSGLDALNVNGGTLALGSNISVENDIHVAGALQLKGTNATADGLTGAGTVSNVATPSGDGSLLTLGANGVGDKLFNGTLSNGVDPLAVTKTGNNRQIFSGTLSYSGATNIDAGQIQIRSAAAPSTAVAVNGDSSTLELDAGGSVGAVSLDGRSGAGVAHILGVSGLANATGAVTLDNGSGDNFNIVSSRDTPESVDTSLTVASLSSTAISGDRFINLGGAGDGTVSSGISMQAGANNVLNKTGTGKWTLAGTLSNLDSADVNDGVLGLQSTLNLTGELTIGSGATVRQIGGGNRFGGSDGLGIAGAVQIDSGGTLDLNGQDATLANLTGDGDIVNSASVDPTLSLGSSGVDSSFGGTISGPAVGLKKVGTNTVTLTNANSYGNGTEIGSGQLQISGNGTLGSNTVTVTGDGTLGLNGVGTESNAVVLDGRGSGAPAHIDNVDGASGLSGGVSLADGTGDNFNIESSAGTLTIGAGGIVSSATSGDRILNLGGDGNGVVVGAIAMESGANNVLNKGGDGKWTLQGAVTNLDSANVTGGVLGLQTDLALVGGLTIGNGGIVRQLGAGERLAGVAGAVQIDAGGVFDLHGFDATLTNVTGTGEITSSSAVDPVLTLGSNGADSAFGGTITGAAVDLRKVGSNTLTLSGHNTYDGATTVAAGTLAVQAGGTLGSTVGATTIANGATLELTGGVSSGENVTLTDSGAAGTAPVLLSTGAANTLTGVVTLAASNASLPVEYYNVQSDGSGAGLGIGSVSSTLLTAGSRVLVLQGTGNGSIGNIAMGAGVDDTVEVDSAGTWGINGTATGVDTLHATDGTLAIGAGANVDAVTTFLTDSDGTIDADSVPGNFQLQSGDSAIGNGTMVGDYAIGGGAHVVVNGTASDSTLEFTGGLVFQANSVLDITIDLIGPTRIDFLDVDGLLTISGQAQVSFEILNGTLSGEPYIFATYGSRSGMFAGTAPSGYQIVYDYGVNQNQIALVIRTEPVPVPAPLALIGLGALALARRRRRVGS